MTWNFILRHWRDALEILILAVGIYYASRFVRGTRGWPVVVGFVVLLVALAALPVTQEQVIRSRWDQIRDV